MSVGSIIGGIVGGVIGFIIGGPTGAYYGFMLGFSLGMVVDPLTPDVPQPGNPDPESFENMSNDVGSVMPDLVGTAKINGHLLWYGNESSSLQSDDSYKYYMSWVLGIVKGPVDTIYAIYKGDDILWEGDLDCPTSGGEETLVIPGFGSIYFYFGTSDQVANTTLGALLSDDTLNSPNRYLCWAFMDSCYIGKYPRTPTLSFVVKKHPVISFSALNEIQTYDYNPAHALWYILHDLAGLPESWLHTSDFTTAASTFYGDILGVGMLFKKQQSALAYIQTLNVHVSSLLYYGSDAKFHLKLIRGDYTIADLPSVDETMLLEEPEFSRRSWIDTVNEVRVQYTELCMRAYYSYVWSTGHNDKGQLALGHTDDKNIFTDVSTADWSSISCGDGFTLGLMADGTLWGVGRNTEGQLGLGHNSDVTTLTQIGSQLWAKAAAGFRFAIAVDTDGNFWGTGENTHGQLGLGHKSNTNVFTQATAGPGSCHKVACGQHHTLIMPTPSSPSLWGAGSGSALMKGVVDLTDFILLDSAVENEFWTDISCGLLHSAMICQCESWAECPSGVVLHTTGDNTYGQIGSGDNNPYYTTSYLAFYDTVEPLAVACGGYHTFVRLSCDYLFCTGRNNYGQLGLGDNTDKNSYQSKLQATVGFGCGSYHTMIVDGIYSLHGTGLNTSGQLGLGDNVNRNSFVATDRTSCRTAACGDLHTFAMD